MLQRTGAHHPPFPQLHAIGAGLSPHAQHVNANIAHALVLAWKHFPGHFAADDIPPLLEKLHALLQHWSLCGSAELAKPDHHAAGEVLPLQSCVLYSEGSGYAKSALHSRPSL